MTALSEAQRRALEWARDHTTWHRERREWCDISPDFPNPTATTVKALFGRKLIELGEQRPYYPIAHRVVVTEAGLEALRTGRVKCG